MSILYSLQHLLDDLPLVFEHFVCLISVLISLIQELQAKTEQICEMAAVMAQAIYIDDEAIQQEQEKMASIESENKGLRELLKISGIPFPRTGTSEEEVSPENDPDIACPSTPKE